MKRYYNPNRPVVELYKNGVLVDIGVRSKIAHYQKQGYVVKTAATRMPMDAVMQREFDTLWMHLPDSEKARLHDIRVDDEMTTPERLMLLKAEIVRRPKRKVNITVTHRLHKKVSLWSTLKTKVVELVDSLLPEPAYSYA